jgi:hypothetical protein
MDQTIFSEVQYQTKKRKTRCKIFFGTDGQADPRETGRVKGSPPLTAAYDAPRSLHAVVLIPQRPGYGRCPVRDRIYA